MPRYAAFLRGMNLGKRRIKNDELRAAFVALGFQEVSTFRASGNVAFEVEAQQSSELKRRIEAGLAAALGYEVPTFLREAGELRAIAAHQPFSPALLSASGGKLQVGMLAEGPGVAAREAVLALASETDRLALGARELYWLPSGGISESDLDLVAVDRLLGLTTMRTKGTIEQMAARHFPA